MSLVNWNNIYGAVQNSINAGANPYSYSQGIINPFYDPGMSMPGVDMDLINQINGYSNIVNPGGSTNPSGPMPNDPYTFQGGGSNLPPAGWAEYLTAHIPPSSNAPPPGSSVGLYPGMPGSTHNPDGTPRTTPPPAPVIASPQLATNMGMQGAQNVGGVGMYTGANGPLDLTRFTPVQNTPPPGAPPGSIPTGDPNTWITPWGATYTTPGAINNQSSADYDAYRQRAFGDIMGPQGRGPQSNPYSELTDALRQAPGSINAQTFNGYLNSLQGQQTGPYPPRQTAPLPPQVATSVQNFPGYNPQPLSGAFPMGDPRATWGGMYDAEYGQGAYARQQQQQQQQQDQILASLGLRRSPPSSGYRTMDLRLDPLGIGMDVRDIVMADGSPVNWDQLTQQYGVNSFGGNTRFTPSGGTPTIGSPGMMGPRPIDPSQAGTGYGPPTYRVGANGQRQWQDPRTGQWLDVMNTPLPGANGWIAQGPAMGMPQGYGNGQMQVDPYRTGGLDPGPGGGQPNYQQMAAQFSSDPAMQQAYLRDMFGGGQQGGGIGVSLPNVDFRAATFGGGSLFPPNTGSGGSGTGSGTNTNIPNTTNPVNTQYTAPGFGGASNRRSGWGSGMSLFGNQFGYGGSTGFGGTQPSQYRGAGTYGRPASYGQSQRPY